MSLVKKFALATVCGLALSTVPHFLRDEAPPQQGGGDSIEMMTDTASLTAEFNRTLLGRQMMQFAADNNITFVIDPDLLKGNDAAEYRPSTHIIGLRPGLGAEEAVIYAAHELRHGWQDAVLHYVDKEIDIMTPRQHWIMRRYLEADATAFSAFFEAQRLQQLGPQANTGDADAETAVAKNLLAEFSSPDGLTLREYRTIALEKFLDDLHEYDNRHLDIANMHTMALGERIRTASNAFNKGDRLRGGAAADVIAEDIAAAPTPPQFEAFIRKFGGLSLDPAVQTSLQEKDVTKKLLLEDYPYRDGTAKDPAAAKKYIATRLDLLDRVYSGYIQWEASLNQTVTITRQADNRALQLKLR